MQTTEIRNLAIIAHVDHGKTTLVDSLLKAAGTFRSGQEVQERVLDSFDQERERGITIFSKHASLHHKGTLVNIVDTPGHADFGGQVERVLGMVDGALLLVDAFEGPMAQTQFVTRKALQLGLKVAVVINKIDRPGCDPHKALDQVFDLLVDLGANDEQLDFPHVFASGRNGICQREMDTPDEGMGMLLDFILEHIPPPKGKAEEKAQLQIASLEYSRYLGRMAVGRLRSGTLHLGKSYTLLEANQTRQIKVQKLLQPMGVSLQEINKAVAGQLILLAGLGDFTIGDTLTDDPGAKPLPRISVDPPTIAMRFSVNDSPLSGRDGGKFLTSNHLRDRLHREALGDVALRIEETDETAAMLVMGRGILHLSIIMEKMRREGYEFTVGRPEVIVKEENGQILEPVEKIIVDVPENYSGTVIDEVNQRRGEMVNMHPEGGQIRLVYHIPSRGLIGLRTRLLSLTKGFAVFQQMFLEYQPKKGDITERPTGALISKEAGISVAYALWKLEERGTLFIGPATEVYPGMVVGENARGEDMLLNVVKEKHLTNIRASGSDAAIVLTPHRKMSLEECLEFINTDECLELTPKSMRLRKVMLNDTDRRRAKNKVVS